MKIVLFTAIFGFQSTVLSAEPEHLGRLSYVVFKYEALPKQPHPDDDDDGGGGDDNDDDDGDVDKDFLLDFMKSTRYRATVVRFVIKLTEAEENLLRELRMSVSRFHERDKERYEKFPGLRISRVIPEGGAAGNLFAEDGEGKWVKVCDITKHGNPVSGYDLIKLSNKNQEILRDLMLRFILSSEIEIEQRPSIPLIDTIIK